MIGFIVNPIASIASRIFKKVAVLAIRVFLVVFAVLFLSSVITIIVSLVIRVPSDMEKILDFHLEETGLAAEVFSNCNLRSEVNSNISCVNLDSKSYSISVDVSLLRSNSNPNLIESEMEFFSSTQPKQNFSVKKVAFVKDDDSYLEKLSDALFFVPRIFGFFSKERILIKFIEEFDNEIFNMQKVKIKINSQQVGVEGSKVYFVPHLSYLQYFIGKTYYITLILVFYGSALSQILLLCIITLYSWLFKSTHKDKKD